MQLPGMSTDPVRVRLEVTWWPESADFSLAMAVWTRPTSSDVWQMEALNTSGSPIRLEGLADRWATASDLALAYVTDLEREHRLAGPFR